MSDDDSPPLPDPGEVVTPEEDFFEFDLPQPIDLDRQQILLEAADFTTHSNETVLVGPSITEAGVPKVWGIPSRDGTSTAQPPVGVLGDTSTVVIPSDSLFPSDHLFPSDILYPAMLGGSIDPPIGGDGPLPGSTLYPSGSLYPG